MTDEPAGSLSFMRHQRLKATAQFQRVFDRRCSASAEGLLVYACENGLTFARLGLSVSRKVGNAVARNRHKRLYREAFRLEQHRLPTGVDLVLVPRSTSLPGLVELREMLVKLTKKCVAKLSLRPPAT